jgi:hypothetical protein
MLPGQDGLASLQLVLVVLAVVFFFTVSVAAVDVVARPFYSFVPRGGVPC